MAARFWVGGTGNWDASDTTHWSASSGGAGGASVPGASDDVTFDGSSGGGTVTVTATQSVNSITGGAHTGTVNFNGQTITTAGIFSWTGTATRSLTLGAASITIQRANGTGWDLGTVTGLTFSGASATITLSGNSVVFSGGGQTYGTVNFTGSGTPQLGNSNTFTNLTRTGTAAKTDTFQINAATQTVTGTFTVNSNSDVNRVLVFSNTVGTARTITASSVVISNTVDFQDITGAGAATWTVAGTGATALGDCGGNSGITFTTPATQTWSGTSGGNWSANAWTSRVPLPQDDVVISSAFASSPTIATDMPRLGKSVDFTGSTNTFTFNPTNCSVYGSLTLISGMTLTGAGALTFSGRGSFSITSAGKQAGCQYVFTAVGGTYTLNDALSTSQNITLNNGTFNANGFNVTYLTFNNSGSATRALTMGSGTWTSTSTATTTVWSTASSGLTFSGANATIVISGASANTRTFAGGGLTYGTLTYTEAGSTGRLDITGANSFAAINFSDVTNARTLRFTAATNTTIRNKYGFNVQGTAGKLMSVSSITAATHTIIGTDIQACNYLSLTNSIASGGQFFAGYNSTNVSGNTGWIFASYARSLATLGS